MDMKLLRLLMLLLLFPNGWLFAQHGDNTHNIGIYYRIGSPWIFGEFMNQTNNTGGIWNRQMTLAHQLGFFWNSGSLTKKVGLTLGVGLEYNKTNLSTSIGYLTEIVEHAIDADGCQYTAFLSYMNVIEQADMHYISIPLTISLGQPHNNRISGYGQISFVPSYLVAAKYKVSGLYSCIGHYSEISGEAVDFTLENFPPLGFGRDFDLSDCDKTASAKSFVLLGRVSGGFYLPLCNTLKGQTSPWVFKVGVNLDIAMTSLSKGAHDAVFSTAQYHINQYNLMSRDNTRYINPGIEVGLIYIFDKK